MNRSAPIAVCSRSFSTHETLRSELSAYFTDIRFNESGTTLSGDSLVTFLADRTAAIVAMETINEDVISRLPQLQAISKYGVGLDRIDQDCLRRHDIRLITTSGVNRNAVAELTIAMMISLLRYVPRSQSEIRRQVWRQLRGRELGSCTVGIIGCGHIGKRVAELCRAFSATVLAHDIIDYPEFYAAHDVMPCNLGQLLTESDIVTIHTPLDATTQNLLSRVRISQMKPGSLLLNTARGGLVDEGALCTALAEKHLAGAGLDVFSSEPPGHHPLLEYENVITTAHIGGHSEDAILGMGRAAIKGLINA